MGHDFFFVFHFEGVNKSLSFQVKEVLVVRHNFYQRNWLQWQKLARLARGLRLRMRRNINSNDDAKKKKEKSTAGKLSRVLFY